METSRPGVPRPDAVILRLKLIGRMEALTLDNISVLPLGRKTRGLLAILALSGRRPVLRLRLAELLWSRRSEEQARASLRQEIHRLLEALSPLGADVITVERHTLALKPALSSVDAERILNAHPSQAESLPAVDGVLLEELNGTDPALDKWLQQERDRLREHAVALFEQMLQRQRDPAGRQAAARQLLLLDGLHERAWQALIRTQSEQGSIGHAMEAAARCAAAFANRPGVEPGPEIRHLLAEFNQAGAGPTTGITHSGPAAPFRNGVTRDPMPGAADRPDAPEQPVAAPAAAATGPAPARPSAPAGPASRPVPDRRFRRDTGALAVVAILPLLDLDHGPDDDEGLQGLVDTIHAGLAEHDQIVLAAGSELEDSLNRGRDDAALRHRFGLDYVLDGTVQRDAARVRVILRLTDIRQQGRIVWAERFEGPAGGLAELEERIAAQVAARLPWEILLVESRGMRRRALSELDPAGMALRAFGAVLTGNARQADQAQDLLERSIAADPGAVLPYMVAGLAHLLDGLQHRGDRARTIALASRDTTLALERAPTLASALALRAIVRSELSDEPEGALALAGRALQLEPGTTTAPAAAAFALARLGRLDEAADSFGRYKRLFPTHPLEMVLDLPGILVPLLQGRFEEAARQGLLATEIRPDFAAALVPFLSALGHLGRAGEAARIRAQLQAVRGSCGVAELVEAAGLRDPEQRERFAEGLRRAGLPERGEPGATGNGGAHRGAAPLDTAAPDTAPPERVLGGARLAG